VDYMAYLIEGTFIYSFVGPASNICTAFGWHILQNDLDNKADCSYCWPWLKTAVQLKSRICNLSVH